MTQPSVIKLLSDEKKLKTNTPHARDFSNEAAPNDPDRERKREWESDKSERARSGSKEWLFVCVPVLRGSDVKMTRHAIRASRVGGVLASVEEADKEMKTSIKPGRRGRSKP